MKYQIVIQKLASKFIRKLPKNESERVLKAIYNLPEGNDIRPLKGDKNKGLLRQVKNSSYTPSHKGL